MVVGVFGAGKLRKEFNRFIGDCEFNTRPNSGFSAWSGLCSGDCLAAVGEGGGVDGLGERGEVFDCKSSELGSTILLVFPLLPSSCGGEAVGDRPTAERYFISSSPRSGDKPNGCTGSRVESAKGAVAVGGGTGSTVAGPARTGEYVRGVGGTGNDSTGYGSLSRPTSGSADDDDNDGRPGVGAAVDECRLSGSAVPGSRGAGICEGASNKFEN